MKSKSRVKELAEVYTNPREVNDMLDLLKDVKYDSRFLEPGCGNGNFLSEIFNRKIKLVKKIQDVKQLNKSKIFDEFTFRLIISLSTIYGVDIDKDNVEDSRLRLFNIFLKEYKKVTKNEVNTHLEKTIMYVLNKNILLGDFIDKSKNINFSQFSEFKGYQIQETVFLMNDLLYPVDEVFRNDYKLFGHVPSPIFEYKPIDFDKVYQNANIN